MRVRIFKKEEMWLVGIVIVSGMLLAAYLWQYDRWAFLYNGDASSYLVHARRLVEGFRPGISLSNIGVGWLPLPYLLFLPFSLVDWLFRNGLAALPVNLPLLAFSAVFLYRILRERVDASPRHAWLLSAAYAVNPSVLYFGVIPMTPVIFLFFLTMAAYYFHRAFKDPGRPDVRALVVCSFAIIAGTLTRYEAWPLPFFLAAVISSAIFTARAIPHGARLRMLGVAALAFIGIGFWLYSNAVLAGDPLALLNMFSGWAAEFPWHADILRGHPLTSAAVYFTTALGVYGPVVGILVLGGFLFLIFRRRKRNSAPVAFFLFLPSLWVIASMAGGGAVMGTTRHEFLNSKFALSFAPLAAVLTAHALRRSEGLFAMKGRVWAVLCWVTLFASPLMVPPLLAPAEFPPSLTLLDNKRMFAGDGSLLLYQTGEALGKLSGGRGMALLLVSRGRHKIMLKSGMPLWSFREANPRKMDERDLQWMVWVVDEANSATPPEGYGPFRAVWQNERYRILQRTARD